MHYAQRRSPSSNAVGIGLVALLHLGLGYALITGFGAQFQRVIHPRTDGVVIVEPKKEEPLVKPVPQDVQIVELKLVYIPPPPIDVARTDQSPISNATSDAPTNRVVAFTPPAPPANDTHVSATPIGGSGLLYPGQAIRAEQEGWVDVQCDVDETGRTSQCTVIGHQGMNAFVDAALKYVTGAQYRPATHNGVPVTEPHHRFHIEFKLNG